MRTARFYATALSTVFTNSFRKMSGTELIQEKNTVIKRTSVNTLQTIWIVFTSLQFLSMLLLTSQQTGMPFLVRAATKDSSFLPTTSVLMMEVLKLLTCCFFIFRNSRSCSEFSQKIRNSIFDNKAETLKVAVPAFIYALQNNLYYIALANIDATTYSVTYQLRILTTALLSVCLLDKRLSQAQWTALCISLAGVVMVQLDQSKTTLSAVAGSHFIGISATVAMCWTSAFAGVYFERMLKNPNADMWIQNLRLSLMTMSFALFTMVASDGEKIYRDGFFQGWTEMIWLITVINSVGGLAVSLVMKYADNVKKTYCQSIAIGLTALISIGIGERDLSMMLSFGVTMVIFSIYIYSFYPAEITTNASYNSYQKLNQLELEDEVAERECNEENNNMLGSKLREEQHV